MTSINADAHVHIHDCFDLDLLFASVLARSAELEGPLILLLSESEGDDYFEYFRWLAGGAPAEAGQLAGDARRSVPPPRGVRFRPSAEPHSLVVESNGQPDAQVYLVAGRQKVSAERIEVLALGLDPGDPLGCEADGALSTEALVARTLDAGALAVLPWGFGKWIGARGAKVLDLAREQDLGRHPRFFLGDIPHRCWPWLTPKSFEHNRVLRGTDPLPLAGLEGSLARYGSCVEGPWDSQRPIGSLLAVLDGGSPIQEVGERDSPWATLGDQLRYRMRRT